MDSVSPVNSPAETNHVVILDSPESPDSSPATSPVNTPTKRNTESPPYTRVRCQSPLYIALQNHEYAVPEECPIDVSPTLRDPSIGMTGALWPPNPPLQRPRPRRPVRRSAPSPPTPAPQRGRTTPRSRYAPPYAPPRQPGSQQQSVVPSERSAFRNNTFPRGRGRNLFLDFANLPSVISTPTVRSAPPSPPRNRSPSPDVFLEIYSHTRHPLDLTSHLTILPSWASKAEKELTGECIICYEENKHLQIRCKQCQAMKVCCSCVVGVYQSINSCPTCRFRGEY